MVKGLENYPHVYALFEPRLLSICNPSAVNCIDAVGTSQTWENIYATDHNSGIDA